MSRPLLTERQMRNAREIVGNLIRAAGITAHVSRPVRVGVDTFDGPREASLTPLPDIQIEPRNLTPENLAELGCDLVAGALPDADVCEGDVFEIDGIRYRATRLDPYNAFGITTHIELYLERSHKDQG